MQKIKNPWLIFQSVNNDKNTEREAMDYVFCITTRERGRVTQRNTMLEEYISYSVDVAQYSIDSNSTV